MSFEPQAGFWDKFVAEIWEKEPTLLRGVFPKPIVTSGDLFRAILNKPNRAGSDRFWVAKGQQEPVTDYQTVSMDMFGPNPKDQDFEGFFRRIRGNLGRRQIGLNVHHLQTGSASLWFRFRDFTHGLLQRVGIPTQACDIDTFFGDYHFTPFGIHQDNASVFAIGIIGRRTYYAWPGDYFQSGDPALHTADSAEMAPHLEKAIKLHLEPGDIAYWPSSYWHVVGSNGQPSAVVQFSTYFGVQLSDLVGRIVTNFLSQRLHDDSPKHYTPGPKLPAPVAHAALSFQKLASSRLIERHLSNEWLRKVSASGFIEVPQIREAASLPSTVSLPSNRPLFWNTLRSGELMVACNGLLFKAGSHFQSLLEELNSGRAVSTENIDADVRSVLQALGRRRAFREDFVEMNSL